MKKKPKEILQIEKSLNTILNKVELSYDVHNLESNITLGEGNVYVLNKNNEIIGLQINGNGLLSLAFGMANSTQKIDEIDAGLLNKLKELNTLIIWGVKVKKASLLGRLQNMTSLSLQACGIKDFTFLGRLKKLLRLDLKLNLISDITFFEKIQLSKLRFLDLGKNRITLVPDNLLDFFPEIEHLLLFRNPISNIPIEIYGAKYYNSISSIKTYFNDIKKGNRKNNEVKLIIIGNGSVGKTQIVKRLVEGESYQFNTQHKSTHGVILLQKEIENKEHQDIALLLNIWDFAGQDIYHTTHSIFMQSRALFLLVWDVENETNDFHIISNKQYRNENLKYWLEYIKYYGQNSPTLIMQNKIDRDVMSLAKPHKEAYLQDYPIVDFIKVSAKTGKGFLLFEKKIIESFSNNIKLQRELLIDLPSAWVNIRNRVREAQQRNLKKIEYSEFEDWCRNENISDSTSILLDFLHNSGVLFYRADFSDGIIILNQSWIIEAIYKVLDKDSSYFEVLSHQEGKFFHKDITYVWKDYSENERKLFIDFMLICELCFETTVSNVRNIDFPNRTFIVPRLLPYKKPNEIAFFYGEKATETKIIKFHFLPPVFIERFIVRVKGLATLGDIWQKGIVVLKDYDSFAIVEANYKNRTIIINYTAKSIELVKFIIQILETIENEGNIKPQRYGDKSIENGEEYLKMITRGKQHISKEEIKNLVAKDKL